MSEAELENAYATIPVDAYIMGASATQPPRFNDELYQQILSSGFVAASRAAAECQVHSRDTLRALDSIEMDAALSEYASGIEWLEAVSYTHLDVYKRQNMQDVIIFTYNGESEIDIVPGLGVESAEIPITVTFSANTNLYYEMCIRDRCSVPFTLRSHSPLFVAGS